MYYVRHIEFVKEVQAMLFNVFLYMFPVGMGQHTGAHATVRTVLIGPHQCMKGLNCFTTACAAS